MPERLIEIAKITKPHGVRGEVVLYMYAESESLLHGEVIVASSATSTVQSRMRIAKTRRHHESVLALFEGVSDRTAAEGLRNQFVLVPRSHLPELDEDEYYLTDMLGLLVIAVEDGKERVLGTLEGIDAPAGQEIWSVQTEDGREILLPAVPEFILDIDLESGEARVAPPAGLLDLYLGTA